MKSAASLLIIAGVVLLVAACGGAGGEGEEQTAEQRLTVLEAQMQSFQDYVVQQANKESDRTHQAATPGELIIGDGVDEDGNPIVRAVPQYSLKYENASENEKEIVLWMADCSARTYLNPDLPAVVLDREVEEAAEKMWVALGMGQYQSFEHFIGQSFAFCQTHVVEDDE